MGFGIAQCLITHYYFPYIYTIIYGFTKPTREHYHYSTITVRSLSACDRVLRALILLHAKVLQAASLRGARHWINAACLL